MSDSENTGACNFLRNWSPQVTLTAIEVDGRGIWTQTFDTDDPKMGEFVDRCNGKYGCYFTVNPVIRPVRSKAAREDIKQVEWFHVDVDFRPGEDLDDERLRIESALRAYKPHPTVIIFTGGGFGAYWRLKEPIPINGDVARADDAALYNKQLELDLEGDSCFDVSRIMRLPGTWNIPSKKKIKRGRVKALAEIVFADWGLYHHSTDFCKAAARVSLDAPGVTLVAPTDVTRVKDIDDLDIQDWCKVLIVQGCDPDEPQKYGSRSDALFAAVCSMVRSGIDDDTVYSVITDPGFAISASVLDKKSGVERYALRQIARAKEESVSPWLRRINEKHAVIGNAGGKCRIIEELYDPAQKRTCISLQSFADFKNRYINKPVKVGTTKDGDDIFKPAGGWWISHPQRREYDTITFAPLKDVDNAYNLWRGFAVEPREGDCSLFLSHIKDNICKGNDLYYKYIISWMARAVQKPDVPGETAIVLRGKQGTGKSIFAKIFGGLFGRHFMSVSDPKHLVGSFNSHLRDCVVLFGDEAFFAGDKKHSSVLKTLITEKTITIEAKGVDAVSAPNYLHVIMASNSDWVVPAGLEERRFFVLDSGDDQIQNTEYFGSLMAQMEQGGYSALLHMLQNFHLNGYNVRNIPQTEALRDQKMHSFDSVEEWWFSCLSDGRILPWHEKWHCFVEKNKAMDHYIKTAQQTGVPRRSTASALGRFMKKALPGMYPRLKQKIKVKVDSDGKEVTVRPYYWELPTLENCRQHWDKEFGGPYEWPVIEDDTQMDLSKVPF